MKKLENAVGMVGAVISVLAVFVLAGAIVWYTYQDIFGEPKITVDCTSEFADCDPGMSGR